MKCIFLGLYFAVSAFMACEGYRLRCVDNKQDALAFALFVLIVGIPVILIIVLLDLMTFPIAAIRTMLHFGSR